MPFKVIGELFRANTDPNFRTYVIQGGTSSGKTYTIMQVFFFYALTEPNTILTVAGQDLPNLKVGALRDAKTIINGSEWMQEFFHVNESGSYITGHNNSVIEFKSYDNAQDAKNGKRDYLFVNEANGIPYDIFWQLQIRTRKKVYIDYNPSARFWAHDDVINTEGTKLIISDHRGNPFLTAEEHERIENIADPELWKVYARGLTGKITGLVLTRWDVVDALPPRAEWKMSAWGMDFGFSCFRGDTLITTVNGEIPIKDVKAGDYVLTRKGFRKVKRNIYNGYKKTIHKKFVIGLHSMEIFCTFEHLIKTNGKWKKYGKLTTRDKLCVLSSSMAWSLEDTRTGNTGITISTSGKKMGNTNPFCCTMQSTKKRTGKSLMAWLFIMRILTRLIIASKTLWQSAIQNTCGYMACSTNGETNTPKKCVNDIIQKIIGKNAGKKCWLNLLTKNVFASIAEKSLRLQTRIKDFAENIVTTDGNTRQMRITSKPFAKIAERCSWVINTRSRNAVAKNVRMNYRYLKEIQTVGAEWCDVYDLEIEDVHEYFANGILVHNCDPTALEHVVLAHGELWVDEEFYETGMTNPDIAERAKGAGLGRGDLIIADSAEPKSIRELHNMGLFITPSVKGADSIAVGLDILRRYMIHFTRRSQGIIGNAKSYQWKRDRDGKQTNNPQDGNDHGIDAIRYVALVKLNARRQGSGSRIKIGRMD